MGGVSQDLKTLPPNHDEARRHQETAPFFVRLWLAKRPSDEDFVLSLQVIINRFSNENLINFIYKYSSHEFPKKIKEQIC